MDDLKINTVAAIAAAEKLRSTNSEIRDNFSNVQAAITRLDNSWEGQASSSAIAKFNELKKNYCAARYDVMESYANFLLNQVGQGYITIGNVNIELSKSFK